MSKLRYKRKRVMDEGVKAILETIAVFVMGYILILIAYTL